MTNVRGLKTAGLQSLVSQGKWNWALNIFKEWRETTSDHEAVLKVEFLACLC